MIAELTDALNNLGGLIDAAQSLIPKLGLVAYGVTALASRLPPPEGTGLWSRVHRVINLVAFNVGYASNQK